MDAIEVGRGGGGGLLGELGGGGTGGCRGDEKGSASCDWVGQREGPRELRQSCIGGAMLTYRLGPFLHGPNRIAPAAAHGPTSHSSFVILPPSHPQESGAKWDTALETQLCYEVKTFLLAGHETSAAMLTWSTYELAANAEYTDKVGCSRRCWAGGSCRTSRSTGPYFCRSRDWRVTKRARRAHW